jgi:hypothetical protein
MRDPTRRSLDSPIRIPGIPKAVPELPDVEAFRHVLAEHAIGQPIQRVDVIDTRVLHGASAQHWQKLLRGQRFGEPLRRDAWLIVPLADAEPIVLLYFGSTGSLNWVDGHPDRHRRDRVVFVFPKEKCVTRTCANHKGIDWSRPTRDACPTRSVCSTSGPLSRRKATVADSGSSMVEGTGSSWPSAMPHAEESSLPLMSALT